MKADTTAAVIAELNNRFRHKGLGSGHIVITSGIQAMPFADQQAIFRKVRSFDAFSEDNDPRGERDFGSFAYKGRKVSWKIDYYDPTLEHGSANPADPAQTCRVLTIMLAKEW